MTRKVTRCILILCSNYTIILPKSCNLRTSEDTEPPNIKEDLANDMDSTAICNLVTGYEVMWIFLIYLFLMLNIFL